MEYYREERVSDRGNGGISQRKRENDRGKFWNITKKRENDRKNGIS